MHLRMSIHISYCYEIVCAFTTLNIDDVYYYLYGQNDNTIEIVKVEHLTTTLYVLTSLLLHKYKTSIFRDLFSKYFKEF